MKRFKLLKLFWGILFLSFVIEGIPHSVQAQSSTGINPVALALLEIPATLARKKIAEIIENGFRDYLAVEFLDTLVVIPRGIMLETLHDAATSVGSCSDSECAIIQGRILGVERVIFLNMKSLSGKRWQIVATHVDVTIGLELYSGWFILTENGFDQMKRQIMEFAGSFSQNLRLSDKLLAEELEIPKRAEILKKNRISGNIYESQSIEISFTSPSGSPYYFEKISGYGASLEYERILGRQLKSEDLGDFHTAFIKIHYGIITKVSQLNVVGGTDGEYNANGRFFQLDSGIGIKYNTKIGEFSIGGGIIFTSAEYQFPDQFPSSDPNRMWRVWSLGLGGKIGYFYEFKDPNILVGLNTSVVILSLRGGSRIAFVETFDREEKYTSPFIMGIAIGYSF